MGYVWIGTFMKDGETTVKTLEFDTDDVLTVNKVTNAFCDSMARRGWLFVDYCFTRR